MAKPTAVVLSSGGMHSLVISGLASREYRAGMLHVQDGRITCKQAAAAFGRQVEHFKPYKSWVVDAPALRQMALPVETAGLVTATGSDAQASLVPMRDLQLLSMAIGFAKHIHATVVMWGVQFETKHTEQVAQNIETVHLMNQLLELITPESPVVVKTPLMGLEDQQVIELGYQMGMPFSATWTCQMASEFPCMSCPACARRTRAFRAAQLVDPLVGAKGK